MLLQSGVRACPCFSNGPEKKARLSVHEMLCEVPVKERLPLSSLCLLENSPQLLELHSPVPDLNSTQ